MCALAPAGAASRMRPATTAIVSAAALFVHPVGQDVCRGTPLQQRPGDSPRGGDLRHQAA